MAAAPDPFIFTHATRRVIQAWGALEKLREIAGDSGARRTAVVLDKFFLGTALAAKVADLIKSGTGTVAVVHAVPLHEPDTASVESCRAEIAAADPDLVVALGGGSAMDTAKIAPIPVRSARSPAFPRRCARIAAYSYAFQRRPAPAAKYRTRRSPARRVRTPS